MLFAAQSRGQTWKLTETMTATLDNNGVFTVTTTKDAEPMPDFNNTTFETDNRPYLDSYYGIRLVVIGDGITRVGNFAFDVITVWNGFTGTAAKSRITSVTLSNSVTTIGASAFTYCQSLESINIPTSVTSIESGAFNRCSTLVSLTIPASVTAIGFYAFNYCTGLKDLTVEWTVPIPAPSFMSANIAGKTLHVPNGTKALYADAPTWQNFGTIVEYSYTGNERIPTQTLQAYAANGMLHITGVQSGAPVRVYNLAGQRVYNGIAKAETQQIPLNASGMYIITSGEQTVKVMMP